MKTVPEIGIRKTNYLGVAIMLILGFGMFVSGLAGTINEIDHELNWVKTTGTVTGHKETQGKRGRYRYLARFKFEANDASGPVAYEVLDRDPKRGQSTGPDVNVIYNPANPSDAMIDDLAARWMVVLLMVALGGLLLTMGVLAGRQLKKILDLKKLASPSGAVSAAEGRFIASKKNKLLSLKRKPNYRLIVAYTDSSGRQHTVESEPIWLHDPKNWARPEVAVPLNIDRAQPSRAWVKLREYYDACT